MCVSSASNPCCVKFFNNALVVGKDSESEVADHLYDLILELHAIDSSVLLNVMPQLEFKLGKGSPSSVSTPVMAVAFLLQVFRCISMH